MALGAELVTNGGFDSDSGWIKDAEWTIAAGVASCINGGWKYIEQDIGVEAGKTYQLVYEVTAYTEGKIRPFIGGAAGNSRLATGIYTEAITAEDAGNLRFRGGRATTSFTGSIDNVSVKEITGMTQGFVG